MTGRPRKAPPAARRIRLSAGTITSAQAKPVFGMAALWDVSIKEDGTTIESCAVITVPGNRVMNDLEYPNGENTGRMPAYPRA